MKILDKITLRVRDRYDDGAGETDVTALVEVDPDLLYRAIGEAHRNRTSMRVHGPFRLRVIERKKAAR